MKKINFLKTAFLTAVTFLTINCHSQGFQISSLDSTQNSYLFCDTNVSLTISALQLPVNSGADIDYVLQGTNFQSSQFQVNINWGDGYSSSHYGGTSTSGSPIPFNPPLSHSYSSSGSYTLIVQITNPQNGTFAIDTTTLSIQYCQTYLYTMIAVDCDNNGSNEFNIYDSVPIILTNGSNQYTSVISGNMAMFTGLNPGTYTISVDPFWLNSNGYVVGNITPASFTVVSPTTTYTTQIILNCANPTTSNQCISGIVFCDANNDGVYDSGEIPIANAPVNIQTNTGITLTVMSDPNGYYYATYNAPNQTPAMVSVNQNWLIQNGYSSNYYMFTTIQTDCSQNNPVINFPVNCGTGTPAQGCVSGFVWCDTNGDGDFDSNEIPLIGAPIALMGTTNTITVFSDSSGFYSYCGPLMNQSTVYGIISSSWLTNHGYTIANPYYTMMVMSGLNTQPIGFGLNCGGTPNTCADLWTTVTPWIGYYQNQTNYIRINYGNYGPGAPGNYTLTLTFPAGVTPITSSINIPGYSIVGNTITWNLNSNLSSFSYNDVIYFNTPSGIPSGTQHYFTSTIAPAGSVSDCYTSNNTGSLLQIVGNSYDPNDKTVDLPVGIDHTVQDALTYIIRFQNTGTAPAQDIYIIDTLSTNLDLTTLEVLETSHIMQLVDLGNGVVRFDFPQIWLPDSTSNEPLSHGHVVFRIKEQASNVSGDEIFNTGYIYFDWNPAIITNTTYNINGSLGLDNLETLVAVFPNPTNNLLTISASTEMQFIRIVDLSGKVILGQTVTSMNETIELESFESGIYILQIETTNGSISKRIVKN